MSRPSLSQAKRLDHLSAPKWKTLGKFYLQNYLATEDPKRIVQPSTEPQLRHRFGRHLSIHGDAHGIVVMAHPRFA
jgi:hypothetical protein